MTPQLVYWTLALVNLGVICALGLHGARLARRGEIRRHRRMMTIAALLVLAFLVSYVLKLAILGREDRSDWTLFDHAVLWTHELFVLQMVIAGSVAGWQGLRLRTTRRVTLDSEDPEPQASVLRRHRIAGRWALVGAVIGLLLAIPVLVGMYGRALG